MLKVISQGQVAIIGHPRGQQIPDREPADLDMDQIFEAALKFDTHALAMQYLRQNRARMENSASEAALSHS